jgi:hypothetical protein
MIDGFTEHFSLDKYIDSGYIRSHGAANWNRMDRLNLESCDGLYSGERRVRQLLRPNTRESFASGTLHQ